MFDFANWILAGLLVNAPAPVLTNAQVATPAPAEQTIAAEAPVFSETEAIAKANASD